MFAHVVSNGIRATFASIPFTFAGVARFNTLTAAQRAAYGFLPVVDVTPAYDQTFSRIEGNPTYTVFPDRVEVLRTVSDLTLAEAKALKLSQIEARRERILEAGVVLGGRTWIADETTRNTLTSIAVVAQAGEGLPASFVWRDSTNSAVSLTLPQLMALLKAITSLLFNTYEGAAQKRDQVAAATTVAQVKAISA